MGKKLFVDLDRTLLDTDVFIAAIWHYLGKKYGVNTTEQKNIAKSYYTYDEDLYNYHFFDHLEALSIGDVQNITFELTLHMRDQFLVYNDTEAGLEAFKELGGATLLTFGNERYQRFKVACVPELASLPLEIVQQHKRHFFSNVYKEDSILIDDKNLATNLPDTVQFVRIDRSQPRPVIDHGNYMSIRKLQNIKEVLQK